MEIVFFNHCRFRETKSEYIVKTTNAFSSFEGVDFFFFRDVFPAAALVVWALFFGGGCEISTDTQPREAEPAVVRLTRPLMGTLVTVTACAPNRATAAHAAEAAFAAFERIDHAASTYKADSEISRFNRSPVGKPFALSKETATLFALAWKYRRLGGGAFDPTVQPLVLQWRRGKKSGVAPTATEWAAAEKAIGPAAVRFNEQVRTATRLVKDAGVNFGGIAKGLAIDEALAAMHAAGATAGLVDAGGDVGSFGKKPGRPGGKRRIGLRNPRAKDEFLTILELAPGRAVATSGDYERYFTARNGKRVCHILDPRTGRPATGVISATVVAPNAAAADALATTVFVLGPETGLKLIERLPETEALIVDENKKLHRSSGFAALEVKKRGD